MATNYLLFSSDMYHMISKFMHKLKTMPRYKDKCDTLSYCSLTLSQDMTGADFLDYLRNNLDIIYQIINIINNDFVLSEHVIDNKALINREFRVHDFKPKNMHLNLLLDLFGWLININSMVNVSNLKSIISISSPAAYDFRTRNQHITFISMYLFNRYSDIDKLLKTPNNVSTYQLLPHRYNPRHGRICIDYKNHGIYKANGYICMNNANKAIDSKVINKLYDSFTIIKHQISNKR